MSGMSFNMCGCDELERKISGLEDELENEVAGLKREIQDLRDDIELDELVECINKIVVRIKAIEVRLGIDY